MSCFLMNLYNVIHMETNSKSNHQWAKSKNHTDEIVQIHLKWLQTATRVC